jgi:hypothetical protein
MEGGSVVAYEKCPACGSDKHQLTACQKCGRTRTGKVRRRAAVKEQPFIQDPAIADYLMRRPVPGVGRFGKPQDKYRWGFYGSKSMSYDIWRKGEP